MSVPRWSSVPSAPRARAARLVSFVALGMLAVPASGLAEEPPKDLFERGRELFAREWVPGDPRAHGGDGLGPLYNESSCLACHNQGAAGGAGPVGKNVDIVTLNKDRPSQTDVADLHPGFRTSPTVILHKFGVQPEYRFWRLRRVDGLELADMAEAGGDSEIQQLRETITPVVPPPSEEMFTGMRMMAAGGRVQKLRPNPRVRGHFFLANFATVTQRNPPPLFGAGLIDAIPAEVLRKGAERRFLEFPAIRGRLSLVDGGRIGRFGWKAQTATLREFVLAACATELGLEVPGHHQADSPVPSTRKETRLDLDSEECDALIAYLGRLPGPLYPRPIGPDEPLFLKAGKERFASIGCATCHTPDLGPAEGIYSDLLLHDMGDVTADSGRSYGGLKGPPSADEATSREWRTPPLWGFRDSGPYFHDGRAKTLDEAVALHGGQGDSTARRYFKLRPVERFQILAFLNTLPAPAPAPKAVEPRGPSDRP